MKVIMTNIKLWTSEVSPINPTLKDIGLWMSEHKTMSSFSFLFPFYFLLPVDSYQKVFLLADCNPQSVQSTHLPFLACCLCRPHRQPPWPEPHQSCDRGRAGSSWPDQGPDNLRSPWLHLHPDWPPGAAARLSACPADCPGCALSWVPSRLSDSECWAAQTPCKGRRCFGTPWVLTNTNNCISCALLDLQRQLTKPQIASYQINHTFPIWYNTPHSGAGPSIPSQHTAAHTTHPTDSPSSASLSHIHRHVIHSSGL